MYYREPIISCIIYYVCVQPNPSVLESHAAESKATSENSSTTSEADAPLHVNESESVNTECNNAATSTPISTAGNPKTSIPTQSQEDNIHQNSAQLTQLQGVGSEVCQKRCVSMAVQCALDVLSPLQKQTTSEDKSTQTSSALVADTAVQTTFTVDDNNIMVTVDNVMVAVDNANATVDNRTEGENCKSKDNGIETGPVGAAVNLCCQPATIDTEKSAEMEVLGLRNKLDSMQNTVIWQALMLRLYGM